MMTAAQQLEFYRTRLGRVVTRLQLQVFEADLARSNLDVMSAALQQTEAAAKAAKRAPSDLRQAVLGQYNRTLASLTQMFPVFFVFESAWRSFLATALDSAYGGGGWWHELRDLVAQGASTSGVKSLAGVSANAELVRTISHALSGSANCGRLDTTYEFVEEMTLGHLAKLIEGHWGPLRPALNGGTSFGQPTWQRFESLFRKVRRARNDAYHHRVIGDRAGVVAAAEQLLDLLDIHLGDRFAEVGRQTPPPLRFVVPVEGRHA